MSNTILFATLNQNKFEEVKRIIPPSFSLEKFKINLPEIQDLDPRKVGLFKTEYALKLLPQNLFAILTDDSGLRINGSSPGAMIKWFLEGIGLNNIVSSYTSGSPAFAQCVLSLGICNSKKIHQFYSEIPGKIINATGSLGFGWDPIFSPTPENRSFAEMDIDEKLQYSPRGQALKELNQFLNSEFPS